MTGEYYHASNQITLLISTLIPDQNVGLTVYNYMYCEMIRGNPHPRPWVTGECLCLSLDLTKHVSSTVTAHQRVSNLAARQVHNSRASTRNWRLTVHTYRDIPAHIHRDRQTSDLEMCWWAVVSALFKVSLASFTFIRAVCRGYDIDKPQSNSSTAASQH